MVKVVGKDDKHVHKISCEKCASILEYTKNETITNTWTDYGGGGAGREFITCPTCGNGVTIRSW